MSTLNPLPEWYNFEFLKKYPYPLLPYNKRYFAMILPNGKVTFDVNQNIVNIEGEIPEGINLRDYSRQFDMFKRIPENFLVIGAGGVGAWFVITLLQAAKYAKVIVFDHDAIEESNLERLPYPKSFVGDNKANSLKKWVWNILTANIVAVDDMFYPEYLDDDTMGITPDIVIDCSDDFETQLSVYEHCLNNNIRFFKIGTFRNFVAISRTVGGWDSGFDVEGTCGNGVPQWQATQMLAAAQLVSYLLRDEFIQTQLFDAEIKDTSLFDKHYNQILRLTKITSAMRTAEMLAEKLADIGIANEELCAVRSLLSNTLTEMENKNELEETSTRT